MQYENIELSFLSIFALLTFFIFLLSQKFINKYGLLGSPVVQKKYLEQGENEYKEGSVIQSELIQCWFVEIKNRRCFAPRASYKIYNSTILLAQ